MNSGRRQNWFGWLLGVAVLLAAGSSRIVRAQDAWEYEPYRIQVWVACEERPDFTNALLQDIRRTVRERVDVVVGSAWDVTVDVPPAGIASDLIYQLGNLSNTEFADYLKPPQKKLKKGEVADPAIGTEPYSPRPGSDALRKDKIFVASLLTKATGIQVTSREFDCRARRWSVPVETNVTDLDAIPHAVFHGLLRTFTPVARLESAKGKNGTYRLRALGLAMDEEGQMLRENSPILIDKGAVMRPYIRSNDRTGDPKPNGIQPTPWTYLVVNERDQSFLRCEAQSGFEAPLGTKSTAKIERFALMVRTLTGATTLRLQTTDKPPQPMSGYDIYVKDPLSEKTDFLGRTDWRGAIRVPPVTFPLRVIYIRNGTQLLARVPMVPGLEAEEVVDLTSDDFRLTAEGLVNGMQSSIMDVVAQRKLIAARFEKRLGEGKLDEAEKLLAEFKALPTREELTKTLELDHQRMRSPHKNVQTKIDKLFDNTLALLTKFVDSDLGTKLTNELAQAKANAPAAPPSN